MSNEVTSIAKRRKIGNATTKSVLMYMADSASDDGSGIWTSKANIALDLEVSRRAVQLSIKRLVEMGIIREAGRRTCKNGFTYEYAINIQGLKSLETTRERHSPVNDIHVTREPHSPQDVNDIHPNHTGTTHEPLFSLSEDAKNLFNNIADEVGWPKVQVWGKPREGLLRGRIKDCGSFENWKQAMEKAAQSDFLSGRKTGSTPASFDWLNTKSNFTKLMEGNYDNRDSKATVQPNDDPALRAIAIAARTRPSQGMDWD